MATNKKEELKKEEEVQEKELQETQVDEAKTEEQENAPEETKEEGVKHTVFGKIDERILARRKARAMKQAEKQPMDKSKKAAMIGGGIAIGVGVLGLGFKALLNAAANYADSDPDTVALDSHDEVIPELPPATAEEIVPEKDKEPEKIQEEAKEKT